MPKTKADLIGLLYPLLQLIKDGKFDKLWRSVSVEYGPDKTPRSLRFLRIFHGDPLNILVNTGKGIHLQARWEKDLINAFYEKHCTDPEAFGWFFGNCVEMAAVKGVYCTVAAAAVGANIVDFGLVNSFLEQLEAEGKVPRQFELVPQPHLVFTDDIRQSFHDTAVWDAVTVFSPIKHKDTGLNLAELFGA